MTQPSRIHLFQAFGVELEYMIVDRDTLRVKPVTDELLKKQLGTYDSDFENGIVTWSNELVLHVVELKSTKPESDFPVLRKAFVENIQKINSELDTWNAMLMPSAAHPFMNPLEETRLWPHDSNEVYAVYNKIFNCSGHGWSNLQSMHLNLPFYDDEEFARLHAAIRLVLPLLPALCASSPILEGKATGMLDTRLQFYKSNQSRIPSITGKVIPEAIFSKRIYLNTIYDKIKNDVARWDADGILNPIWVNSRGAIPRFDRGSIEIRVMDIQECPGADLAIASLVIETIRALAAGSFETLEDQMKHRTEMLAAILDETAKDGLDAKISAPEFLHAFGIAEPCTARDAWHHIRNKLHRLHPELAQWDPQLSVILSQGTLSNRILRNLGDDLSPENISRVYRKLAACLEGDTMLI